MTSTGESPRDVNTQTIQFHPRVGEAAQLRLRRRPIDPSAPVYIHIPFCVTRCHFCDFVIVAGRRIEGAVIDRYLRALFGEIEPYLTESPLDLGLVASSQIGGGTPTYLSAAQLTALLEFLERISRHATRRRTVVEGFPSSITPDKLSAIASFKSTQLNIGVQSFSDDLLSRVGRRHEAVQAVDAIRNARRAGIGSLGIDLIYGLPGSTLVDARADVDRAIQEEVDHVTLYPLWVYPGSPLSGRIARGALGEIGVGEKVAQLTAMDDRLRAVGYRRYTAFHYARQERDVHQYGLAQMNGADWIGFGQGAVSQIGDTVFENEGQLHRYCELIESGGQVATARRMTPRAVRARMLCYSFRRGFVDEQEFVRRFAENLFTSFGEQLTRLLSDGLIEAQNGMLRLTTKGIVCIGSIEKILSA